MSRTIAVLALLACFPASAPAATHDVSIVGLRFSPNDLTIEVGDTVRWTNSGSTHDVTADDGTWGSPTGTNWTFSRTFNSVEEVFYHCSVHSSPGLNINNFMNGRINVVESDEPPFAINTHLSDAWFNPITNGQGFFIIVWEDIGTVFLSWFTYDTERPPEDVMAILGDPGHRWLTAQGAFSGDTATLEASLTEGGVFDAALPAPDPAQPVGNITVTWTGCNAGLLAYDLPGLGLLGEIPIERIVLDNVPACEAAQPMP